MTKQQYPMNYNVTCFIDGGSRGNPGPAALGVVIKIEEPQNQFLYSQYLGEQTNNYAEYSAIIYCLKKLKDANVKSFQLFSDSQLVIKQLNGEFNVRSPEIKPLYKQVKALLKNFNHYELTQIPRTQNKLADKLVNICLDKHEKGCNGQC